MDVVHEGAVDGLDTFGFNGIDKLRSVRGCGELLYVGAVDRLNPFVGGVLEEFEGGGGFELGEGALNIA